MIRRSLSHRIIEVRRVILPPVVLAPQATRTQLTQLSFGFDDTTGGEGKEENGKSGSSLLWEQFVEAYRRKTGDFRLISTMVNPLGKTERMCPQCGSIASSAGRVRQQARVVYTCARGHMWSYRLVRDSEGAEGPDSAIGTWRLE